MVKDFLRKIQEIPLEELNSIYAFVGENSSFYTSFINIIKEKLQAKNGLDFDFSCFSAIDIEPLKIFQDASSSPFISPKKIIIYKNIDQISEQDKEHFSNYFSSPCKTTSLFLFFTDAKVASKKLLGDKIEKFTISSQGPLERNYIMEVIQAQGKKISPKALDLLLNSLPENNDASLNEIEKIITYAGTRLVIEEQDVLQNLKQSSQYTIFQLIDDLLSFNKKEALKKLCIIIKLGASSQELLAMFYWSFKRMWLCFDLQEQGGSPREVAMRIGVKDWALNKFLKQAGNFNKPLLKRVFSLLAKAEFDVRNSVSIEDVVLEKLVIDVCSLKTN